MSAPPTGVASAHSSVGAPAAAQTQRDSNGQAGSVPPGGVDSGSVTACLTALKRADPCVCAIIARATQVCGYVFVKQAWEKSGVEGTLFLCERSAPPRHSLIVLNRSSPSNMYEPITDQLDVTMKLPYIFYRTPKGITSLWFYDVDEGQVMYEQILKVQTELKRLAGVKPNENVMDMLASAQHRQQQQQQQQQQMQVSGEPAPMAPGQGHAMPVALAHIFGGGAAPSPMAQMQQPQQSPQAPAQQNNLINGSGASAVSAPGGPPAGEVAHLVPGAFSAAQLEMAMKAGGNRAYETQGRRSADLWSTQSVDGSVAASVATQRSQRPQQAGENGGGAGSMRGDPPGADVRSAMLGRLLGLTPQAVDEVVNRGGLPAQPGDSTLGTCRFDESTTSTVGGANDNMLLNDSSLLPPTEFGMVQQTGGNMNDNGSNGTSGTNGDLKRNYSTIPNVGSQRSSPANEMSRLSLSTRGNESMGGGGRVAGSELPPTDECGAAAAAQMPSITGVAPLTRDQMLQALNYLLQHDAGFITQLHEAYVKCINERMLASTRHPSSDRN